MRLDTTSTVARVVNTLTRSKALLAAHIRSRIKARKHRTANEREFYRNLTAYCLVNNVSPVFEDDWKTGR